jgi:hypothetical protein
MTADPRTSLVLSAFDGPCRFKVPLPATAAIVAGTRLTLVHVSDTHDRHGPDMDVRVPPGDVLIHSGDFLVHGGDEEIDRFVAFLARQPHPTKIVIGGSSLSSIVVSASSNFLLSVSFVPDVIFFCAMLMVSSL